MEIATKKLQNMQKSRKNKVIVYKKSDITYSSIFVKNTTD
jgi:hypothetical protein